MENCKCSYCVRYEEYKKIRDSGNITQKIKLMDELFEELCSAEEEISYFKYLLKEIREKDESPKGKNN